MSYDRRLKQEHSGEHKCVDFGLTDAGNVILPLSVARGVSRFSRICSVVLDK